VIVRYLRNPYDFITRPKAGLFREARGLNSGEVVVGTIGVDLKTAHGNTVGLGQRMEQLATPDRVYLTENSVKLVSGFFRVRDLGPFELKGVSAPVRVCELGCGRAPHPARSLPLARLLTLRRRQSETAALEAALARAISGSAQVLGIVGVVKPRAIPCLLRR
jgi:adenylate/guanylate cyclase family protein